MALDSANVRVAVTGAVYVGAHGTTAPADADATLNVAFKDLGYVGEDGVTETRDRSTDTIKGWQNAAVVREVVTEAKLSYKFVLIETKKETVELYYGTTLDDDTGAIIIDPGTTGGRQAMVIDVIDGDSFIRTYAAEAEVTEVGDQVYASGEPVGYEVTVTCYYSSAIGGTAVKFYSDLVVP